MAPAKDSVTKPARRRGWRIFFTTFKWCRISLLLLILTIIVLGLFLNHVGLPGWLERRVEEQFRSAGWELKFSRLRLRWYHGIVADDLQMRRTNTWNGPHLFLQRAEFRLNSKALQHLDLEADSVLLHGGRLVWPLPGTNQPQRTFTLDDIGGELFFKAGDFWELRYLEARTLGAQVRFRGDITNASYIREWKLPERAPQPPAGPGNFWQRFLAAAEKIKVAGTPELNTVFSGDARNWRSFEATVKFTGHGVESPWGGGTNLSLVAHLLPPPRSNDAVRADLKLTADYVRSPWGTADSLETTVVAEPSYTQLFPTNLLLLLELRGARSSWQSADRLMVEFRSTPSHTNDALNESRFDLTADGVTGRFAHTERLRLTTTTVHVTTNLFPVTLDTTWTLQDTRTAWVTSQWTRAGVRLELPAMEKMRSSFTNATWPERLREVPWSAQINFSNILAPSLEMERTGVKARWDYPNLVLETELSRHDASAKIGSALDTLTRELRFQTSTRFDPQMLAPFLTSNTVPLLRFATFKAPPQLEVRGRMIVPDDTNAFWNWRRDILPSLSMAGRIDVGECVISKVACSSLELPFTVTNMHWALPGARITRTEGSVDVSGGSDLKTGDFQATFRNGCDLLSLGPVFPEREPQTVFSWFQLTEPADIRGEVRGNWNDFSRFWAAADLGLTNATFRGQSLQSVSAHIVYTNRFISIVRPLVLREGERGQADGVGIDLARPRLYLTNAFGNIAPRVVTKCINDDADRVVAPFIFDIPPNSRANGSVPLGKSDHTENIRFDIDGGPFHWQRFNLETIRGAVLWRGNIITITNIVGAWHDAPVNGWVRFEITAKGQPDLVSFQFRLENAELREMLRDLQPGKTNKVEGKVSGEVFVTSGDTVNMKSWQGYGHAQLTNGLIWEIPLFGVFSPVLNAFFPGLGNSRAKHAIATYGITNGIIHTRDLEIRATAMRMKYQGWVDFDGKVDGRMEAELLRDMPAVGFLISKVFWPVTKLFEYKITGTLENPKIEQLYAISKLFILPFAPIKTIKDILNQDFSESAKPATQTPAPSSPKPDEKPPQP